MIAPWFYSAAQVATEREFTPILQNKIIIYRDIKNNTEKMWYSTSDLKLQLTSSQSHIEAAILLNQLLTNSALSRKKICKSYFYTF